MKTARIFTLVLFLVVPSVAFSQTSRSANAAANKSWQAFWRQFSVAVNKKNRAAFRSLMSSQNDFQAGGGAETPDEWLQRMDSREGWRELQQSVASGTVPYKDSRRPARVTKDNVLLFEFIGGRWRFIGVMGD